MIATGVRTAVAGLSLLLSCAGCSEREAPVAIPEIEGPAAPELSAGQRWQPAHRFVRAEAPDALTSTATIGNETRPVLRSPSKFTLNYAPTYRVPESGEVSLRPPLPPDEQHESVYLEVRVKPDGRWVPVPGQLVDSVMERGKLRVHVDFELPEAAGREAGVWVQGLSHTGEPYRSASFRVPAAARLDFAIGILAPAHAAGPVDFSVSACPRAGEPAPCETFVRKRLDPIDRSGFVEQAVGLAPWEGKEIALEFHATPSRGGASLPVFADPVVRVPASPDAPRNLVLISLDTLRADHVGAYGYARDTTPFLDELASRGALFEQYVAAASSTRPSHMTMFTSLQPSVHGATENTGVRNLPPGATTLAERFREAGIATAAITENGAIDRSRGFGRGFDFYLENRDSERADFRTGHIEATFAGGLAWLDRNPGRRFFLFLHTYEVHNPFTPPPEYDAFFAGDPGPLAPPEALRGDWDPRLYDREIRYADDQVRDLVAALDERGLLEDTWLVVTSDHGEAFLEHGFVAHGANVHREVVNVPWIVAGPDVPPGLRLSNPVPMVDLMPTLLDLMGVAPTGAEMGRSQAALILGHEPEPAEVERAIYSEAWAERAYRAQGFDLVPQPTLALRLSGRKLVRAPREDGFHYELYDLVADPLEQRDLYPDDPAAAADLQRILRRYEAAVKAYHDRLEEPDGDAPTPVDPDLEEKLRALGYLD